MRAAGPGLPGLGLDGELREWRGLAGHVPVHLPAGVCGAAEFC